MKHSVKLISVLCLMSSAYADIGDMATSINSTFSAIASLIGGGAYLFGLLFVIGGLLKFKQHKDNPQQVQIGTCFTLLGIGILLIFLPTLVGQAGDTVFSSGGSTGGAGGTGFSDLSGS